MRGVGVAGGKAQSAVAAGGAARAAAVAALDRCLPQTQCGRCGYPGCRAYAEALLQGEAANRCAPGGTDTALLLSRMLDRPAPAGLDPRAMQGYRAGVARIDPDACIGCTLCIPPCPTDAILGARGGVHLVLEEDCTGCDLCLQACPVECISLAPAAGDAVPAAAETPPTAEGAAPIAAEASTTAGDAVPAAAETPPTAEGAAPIAAEASTTAGEAASAAGAMPAADRWRRAWLAREQRRLRPPDWDRRRKGDAAPNSAEDEAGGVAESGAATHPAGDEAGALGQIRRKATEEALRKARQGDNPALVAQLEAALEDLSAPGNPG